MTSQEFLDILSINGTLIAKRCVESWLIKHDLVKVLDTFVDTSFGSLSDRIRHVKYGGGYCAVCGIRTRPNSSGIGFNKHCWTHYKADQIGQPAHNRSTINISEVLSMYYIQQLTLIEIAERYDFSNVTLANRLKIAGFELRSHKENQRLHSRRGYTKPHIIIDRKELVHKYLISRIPMKILAKEYGCDKETIRRFLYQEGVHQRHRQSYIENIIETILKKHNLPFVANKKLIPPKYIDFYLPDFKIGIECHGLYIHSHYPNGKPKLYHNEKYVAAEQRGIKLFQFWEDDIRDKIHIIESIILNSCKMNNEKVNARECIISKISWEQLSRFCDDNHLQGSPAKNVKGIGLIHNDVLVSVIGFNQYNKVTTIQRFCTLKNLNVRGGFSKLIAALPGSIIKTYSSNDTGSGDLYKKTGFVLSADRKFDMWYTDFKYVLNREKYMKSKLEKMLQTFDNNKTEMKNMTTNGYGVIYKSGTKTWILTR